VENRVCLSRGVQVAGATWWTVMRIVTGVGDLMQRTGDSRTGQVLGGRMIGGRVTLCVVCTMHVETRSSGFIIETQNQGRRFVIGLASRPLGWFVSDLASKQLGRFVSGLTSKPLGRFVSGLASKPLGQFSLI
jgi:hypothetical protein